MIRAGRSFHAAQAISGGTINSCTEIGASYVKDKSFSVGTHRRVYVCGHKPNSREWIRIIAEVGLRGIAGFHQHRRSAFFADTTIWEKSWNRKL
jgi:hypothetical protein